MSEPFPVPVWDIPTRLTRWLFVGCVAFSWRIAGAAELTSPYTYQATIPYRAAHSGPSKDEVELYRINTFVFADAKGVPYTERPYSDPCYRIYPNQGENVARLEARVILGLLDMHEATGDPAFLEQIVVHADRVLNCRLDRRNQQLAPQPPARDTQRNSATFAAWPTWSYTHPRAPTNHVSHSVHAGYFVYAVARFVRFVEQRKLDRFRDKAREYLPLLEQSVAAFDAERNQQGLYVFPQSADKGPWRIYVSRNEYLDATNVVQPLNMQAVMGLAFCELQAVPGLPAAERREYRARAARIAKFFRSQLQRDRKHDSYTWPYWSWKPGDVEDVSHAALDVDLRDSSRRGEPGRVHADRPASLRQYVAERGARFARAARASVVRRWSEPAHRRQRRRRLLDEPRAVRSSRVRLAQRPAGPARHRSSAGYCQRVRAEHPGIQIRSRLSGVRGAPEAQVLAARTDPTVKKSNEPGATGFKPLRRSC